MNSLSRFLIFVALVSTIATAAPKSLFKQGEHCVAYKTKSQYLYVASIPVIGRSCDISAQIIPQVGGLYSVEINIPIGSFQSGESERDRDVAKILHAETQPSLVFLSKSFDIKEWKLYQSKGRFSIPGSLEISGEKYPLTADVVIERGAGGLEIDGVVHTTFKAFNLKPPKLFKGFLANVKDDLELHFHLQSTKTMGADTILSL